MAPTEVAFDAADIQRLLQVVPPEAVLVGGRALAYWAQYFGVAETRLATARRNGQKAETRSFTRSPPMNPERGLGPSQIKQVLALIPQLAAQFAVVGTSVCRHRTGTSGDISSVDGNPFLRCTISIW